MILATINAWEELSIKTKLLLGGSLLLGVAQGGFWLVTIWFTIQASANGLAEVRVVHSTDMSAMNSRLDAIEIDRRKTREAILSDLGEIKGALRILLKEKSLK